MKAILVYLLSGADGIVGASCDDPTLPMDVRHKAESKALFTQQMAGLSVPCFMTVHVPM